MKLKRILLQEVLRQIPEDGIHFRELYRRLVRRGVLASDRTLSKYLDHLIAGRHVKAVRGSHSAKKMFYKVKEMDSERDVQLVRELLARAAAAIVSHAHRGVVEEVRLFGSVSRKTATAESDVDLLIVIKDGHSWFKAMDAFYDDILPVAVEFGVQFSLLVYNASQIEALKLLKAPFVVEAEREGVIMYKRSDGEVSRQVVEKA